MEAEDGVILNGLVVYDAEASSCYAVEGNPLSIDFIVDSTSLDWARPLMLRVVYKAMSEGNIYVYALQQDSYYLLAEYEVSPSAEYTDVDLGIPASREPFSGIGVDSSNEIRIDAIQLAPSTGDWPPLNPCSD